VINKIFDCRKGNKQHTQLNEAFSSRFSLGSHQDRKAGQPAAESAGAPEASNTANPGSAAAQEVPARAATFGSQAEQSSQAAPHPGARGNTENDEDTNRIGAEPAGHSVLEGTAFPEVPSAGQKGQPHSAAGQPAAYVPCTGSLAGDSLGARSMSEDSSADSGLPRGVLHHSSSRSPMKGNAYVCKGHDTHRQDTICMHASSEGGHSFFCMAVCPSSPRPCMCSQLLISGKDGHNGAILVCHPFMLLPYRGTSAACWPCMARQSSCLNTHLSCCRTPCQDVSSVSGRKANEGIQAAYEGQRQA